MKFIDLAFRLGVIFAIFGFIWGFFQLILTMLRGPRPKTIIEEYALNYLKYFFLVDVTFLFCLDKGNGNELLLDQIILTGFILILYFVGKLQNKQNQFKILNFTGNALFKSKSLFNLKAEIGAIIFSLLLFLAFFFYPDYALNPISNWFYESILEIEKTFFFGTIFKIIGFFVLLGILFKLLNGFFFLLSGRPLMSVQSQFNSNKEEKDAFDDFEEL